MDAVPALIQALKDQDPWIRGRLFHYNAVSALGPIGSVDAVPAPNPSITGSELVCS
ncbi:MAG: HEAT repeat domain-containing protein [Candidatus Poribacteria bacterium]